jgi:hypothetical protein
MMITKDLLDCVPLRNEVANGALEGNKLTISVLSSIAQDPETDALAFVTHARPESGEPITLFGMPIITSKLMPNNAILLLQLQKNSSGYSLQATMVDTLTGKVAKSQLTYNWIEKITPKDILSTTSKS